MSTIKENRYDGISAFYRVIDHGDIDRVALTVNLVVKLMPTSKWIFERDKKKNE